MIIAVHCLNFQKQQQNYLLDVILFLAAQKAQHHFIIFTETQISLADNLKNVEWIPVQPAIKNKLSLQYWYRLKMPGILKNKKVNIFISNAGMLCKNIIIPQYLFIRPEIKSKNEIRKIDNFIFQYPKLFATQSNRAQAIFITNPALAYLNKNKKIPCYTVYHGLCEAYKPIGFEEKNNWIDKHMDGFDYFVFHVSETTKAQVMPMLKAFSIFKKWTESNMKLVLLLHFPFSENDIPRFNLYKYRKEIDLINFADDAKAATLYACAFLHIYLPGSLANENFALHALKTGTALLTTDNEIQKQRFSSAAAYCNLNDKAISEKLLYYYKSDVEKDNLIARAAPILKNYTLKNSAAQIATHIDI